MLSPRLVHVAAGRLRRVEIKRNYGFVEYENLDDAAYALKKMNGSELDGRTLTVSRPCCV